MKAATAKKVEARRAVPIPKMLDCPCLVQLSVVLRREGRQVGLFELLVECRYVVASQLLPSGQQAVESFLQISHGRNCLSGRRCVRTLDHFIKTAQFAVEPCQVFLLACVRSPGNSQSGGSVNPRIFAIYWILLQFIFCLSGVC